MLTALLIGGILAVVIAGLVFSLSCRMWRMIINSRRRAALTARLSYELQSRLFCKWRIHGQASA